MQDEIVIKSEFMFDEGDSNNEQQIESNGKKSRCPKTKGCQYKKIISFIEEESNSKGAIYERQKLSSEQWNRLTVELNAIGPPEHTIDEWKKVWTDFKGNRKRKNRELNATPLEPFEMCIVSGSALNNGDSKVAESQYDSWTITDQSNASNDTPSQSNTRSNTKQEPEITSMENFHSEILNKIDLVVGEQARLNMKMDVLMEQQLRLQENFEKLLKVVEEKVMATPDKSEKDRKDYRLLKLKNGITSLIISDPTPILESKINSLSNSHQHITVGDETGPNACAADDDDDDDEDGDDNEDEEESDEEDACNGGRKEKLAACSLCVNVGSFSDPRDIQGLAHFLEHMIFMGSKKFPSENEFDQYIKRCAGFDNADTDLEETSFYFEVSEKYLDGALDRFASLFKEPLMLKECMTREREAVESEFRSKMQREDVRRDQLFSSILSNAEHPCSIFTWGNLKTLKDNLSDDELHRRVHEFQKRHYSAHRMFVCIQARLPLDDIQTMLLEHFCDVPSNELPGDDFSQWNHQNAFQDVFADKIYVIKPVANLTKVDVTFCLESLTREYKTKPHDYIAFLLGHEGKGSLTSYLRKKNLILELIAGVDENGFGSNVFYSLFTITVYLTQKGMDNVKEVLEAIFGFLKFIEILEPIATQSLYSELQTIENNNFRFQTERNALDNVEDLVVNLKYYPPKDILTGPNLFFEYDYNAIQSLIEKINRTKMNIILTTKTPFEGREFDQVESWFGTEYCALEFPKDWLELRANPKHFDEFTLPETNLYIPTDLTILYDPTNTKVSVHPEKIMENDVCELWYRQDNKFLLPNSYYNFYFNSPMARGSIENVILLSLYTLLLKYKIVETLYPATVAGLIYATYLSERGLVLKVSGYSQHLHHLVEAFIEKLIIFGDEVTEQEFTMFVEQQMKIYCNALINPKTFSKLLRLSIIDNDFHPTYEKFKTLKKLTLSDFRSFAGKFLQQMKIQGLFQGNLTHDSAKKVMDKVLTHLKPQPIKEPTLLELRSHKLPKGAHYLYCSSMNENDVNTWICNFYQIGPVSIKTNSLIDLLMMVAEEPLFDSLRSKEQLGYDVSCCLRYNNGILGYSIVVNSQESKFSAEYVEERIEAFRTELLNIIRATSDNDFEQFKESVIKIKLTEDNNLNDEVCRHWTEIITNEYAFDRAAREVECLKKISKAEFVEFYEKHLQENTKKLSVQVIGKSNVSKDESDAPKPDDVPLSLLDQRFGELKILPMSSCKGQCIKDISDFVKSLELYPVTLTNFDC